MPQGKEHSRSIYLLFIPLIFITLIFQIMRVPGLNEQNRPDLMVLIILFFAMINPKAIPIELAWICGFVLDILSGAPLGINALLYAAQYYLVVSQFTRFAKYAVWQQALIIGVVNIIANVIGYWIEHIIGQNYYELNFIIPGVIMTFLWPLIYLICMILCRTFSVIVKEEAD